MNEEQGQHLDSFANFCSARKIARDKIKWKVVGDRCVKVSIDKGDLQDGGWGLVSMGLMFALRELNVTLDVTLRETDKALDIVLEK